MLLPSGRERTGSTQQSEAEMGISTDTVGGGVTGSGGEPQVPEHGLD